MLEKKHGHKFGVLFAIIDAIAIEEEETFLLAGKAERRETRAFMRNC